VGARDEASDANGVDGDQSSNTAMWSGAAYVFVRSGHDWTQQAYLKASNSDPVDEFGQSVAISMDTIVVGAIGESSGSTGVNGNQADESAGGSGAAYVFTRSGSTWSQQAYLKASNSDVRNNVGDYFGISVAIFGDLIAVGAPNESSGATGVNGDQRDISKSQSGAAYVYSRDAGTWSQRAYLKASNTDTEDMFGRNVAVSSDAIAVGAVSEDSRAVGINGDQSDNTAAASGAIYVWDPQAL
jgi:hypothetical protein